MGQLKMDLYIRNLQRRYLVASKREKTMTLNEFCETSGYHRKHAIRILKDDDGSEAYSTAKQKRGRKPIYAEEGLLEALRNIWLQTDFMCSKRLKAAIPLWLLSYETHYGPLEPGIKDKLVRMSQSTIDRLLKPDRVKHPFKHSGTKPGSLLKKQIPIKTDQWNEAQPGFMEADTVAHCGDTLMGDFVWSLTMTDIHSGWTENRAVWNKGAQGIVKQIQDIEENLTFPILGFDCDNGSEFLNHYLIRYFQKRPAPVQFTRSRPYHKNDNAHVEQKNWTHVRQLFGYYRLDDKDIVEEMNSLYKEECSLMQNYFCPSVKLLDKRRIKSKIHKVHSQPMTPYQRLMLSEDIADEAKEKMTDIFIQLDPFDLRDRINRKLKKIFEKINLKYKGNRKAI